MICDNMTETSQAMRLNGRVMLSDMESGGQKYGFTGRQVCLLLKHLSVSIGFVLYNTKAFALGPGKCCEYNCEYKYRNWVCGRCCHGD